MDENIYQTPKSDVTIHENYQTYALASAGQRFSNMLLDMFFFFAYAVILGIVLGLAGLSEQVMEMNDNLFGLIIMTTYYLPQEAIWGRTLGKLITKTKVVDLEGNKISLLKALGRTACRFIPFEAFTFLGGGGRPHGLHDKLPKTKVISLKKA